MMREILKRRGPGAMCDRGWGIAYIDPCYGDCYITAPIPWNYLIGLWHMLMWKIKRGPFTPAYKRFMFRDRDVTVCRGGCSLWTTEKDLQRIQGYLKDNKPLSGEDRYLLFRMIQYVIESKAAEEPEHAKEAA
jgi:hypothetical protein